MKSAFFFFADFHPKVADAKNTWIIFLLLIPKKKKNETVFCLISFSFFFFSAHYIAFRGRNVQAGTNILGNIPVYYEKLPACLIFAKILGMFLFFEEESIKIGSNKSDSAQHLFLLWKQATVFCSVFLNPLFHSLESNKFNIIAQKKYLPFFYKSLYQ